MTPLRAAMQRKAFHAVVSVLALRKRTRSEATHELARLTRYCECDPRAARAGAAMSRRGVHRAGRMTVQVYTIVSSVDSEFFARPSYPVGIDVDGAPSWRRARFLFPPLLARPAVGRNCPTAERRDLGAASGRWRTRRAPTRGWRGLRPEFDYVAACSFSAAQQLRFNLLGIILGCTITV